jgi:hypothetical protein
MDLDWNFGAMELLFGRNDGWIRIWMGPRGGMGIRYFRGMARGIRCIHGSKSHKISENLLPNPWGDELSNIR